MTQRKYRRIRKEPEVDPTRLEECSDTELVHLCRMIGYRTASRAMHRDDLIALARMEILPTPDPLEIIRRKTYKKVQGRALLRTVMNCDLECLACPHDQVVQCYAINHGTVDPVQLEDT
jgi:hypothetical protein